MATTPRIIVGQFAVCLVGYLLFTLDNAIAFPTSQQNSTTIEVEYDASLERPQLRFTPSDVDQIFRVGDTFELTCEADFMLEWRLPSILDTRDYRFNLKDELDDRIEIDDTGIDPESSIGGYSYRSTLKVINAKSTDTGYYWCHHRDSTAADEEAKIYVYVEDEENLIVQHKQVMMFAQRYSRHSIIVPCKPSHPDIEVAIMIEDGVKAKWPYDPHHGFFIDNALISKAKSKPIYRCVARHPKGYQADAAVYIWKPYNALISTESEVKIRPPPRHIVVGQPFKLNCSTTYYQQANVSLELHWLVPNRMGIDGNRIRTQKVMLPAPAIGGRKRVTQRLILNIANATLDDAGFYLCVGYQNSSGISFMESADVFIDIHNMGHETYVIVTTPYNEGRREVEAGRTASLVAYFDAKPDPVLIEWYKGNATDALNTTSKYVVHRSWGKTYLKIRESTVADSGVYRLVLTAGNHTKVTEFTLQIKHEKPPSTIMGWRFSFDLFSPFFWINCQPPMVGFSFLKCRSPNPCHRFDKVARGNDGAVWEVDTGVAETSSDNEIVLDPLTIFINSTAQPNLVSRHVNNKTGVNNHNETAAGILKPARFFQLGWVVNSYYNTSGNSSWTWIHPNGTSVDLNMAKPPPGFRIIQSRCVERRGYCYRVKGINTTSVNQSSIGHTVRSGEMFSFTFKSNRSNQSVTIPIKISDVKKPKIYNSSEAEVVVREGESVTLFCRASGIPWPTSVWIKDGELVPDAWVEHSDTGTLLQIDSVNEIEHAGQYTCQFRNVAGIAEEDIELHVVPV